MKRLVIVLLLCLAFLTPAAGCNQSDLESKKATAEAVVHSAATGLGAVLVNYENETDRVNFIRQYIDPITFYNDDSGYLFVYYNNCLNVALPNPKELEGQVLYDKQDSQGNYPIRILAETAAKGGGFCEYYWPKPGSTGDQHKISYVEPIPGTDYFIGTGIYAGK